MSRGRTAEDTTVSSDEFAKHTTSALDRIRAALERQVRVFDREELEEFARARGVRVSSHPIAAPSVKVRGRFMSCEQRFGI